jgi:hypothetical protein
VSALTQDTLHPVKKKLTPEQREIRLQQAEKILGRKLPRKTTTVIAQRDQ